MTWSEVRDLASDPAFTIGAHTVQHLFLPAQADETITAELRASRETLESITGAAVDMLAYPFGAFDERTIAAARTVGYRLAVIRDDRPVSASDDRLALPRVEVTDEPLDRFVARIDRLSSSGATR